METSKEELQSVNEELHTVNAELSSKVDDVDRANSDLHNIFEGTRIATVFLDQNLVIRSFTPAVTSIFNVISTDRGRPLTGIVSHLENRDLSREIRAVLERGEPIESNVRRADDTIRYLVRILPYRGHNNQIEGVLATFVDITRIVQAEAHQRALVEKLNHRVRNMLTVVNSIAQQTLRHSRSPDEFGEAFSGRTRALSIAYNLVAHQSWGHVALHDIVAEQLQPYLGDTAADRVRLEGPAVAFDPAATFALSLVVHELVTNAVKHGALSTPTGKIEIRWEAKGSRRDALVLRWREQGGPAVRKPRKKGFGSELIDCELTSTLGGEGKYGYGASGFSARISLPLGRNGVLPQK